MKTRVAALGAAVVVGLAGFASAKTVALWPIEYDEIKRSWNPFGQLNVVDGSYPLYLNSVNTTDARTADVSIGWELPPNPDPSVPFERARNGRAAGCFSSDGNVPSLINTTFGGDHLTRLHDYTVELYFKLLDLPSSGGFYYLFGGLSKETSASTQDDNNRWMVSIRHNNNDNTYYWNFYSAPKAAVGDKTIKTLTSDEVDAVTNSWHHLAFTHAAKAASSGKEEWALYLDGEQVGSTVKTTAATSISQLKDRNFEIGGRFAGNRPSMLFDYIRVSDTVLEPTDFLCAGGTPSVRVSEPTLAYWKFDVAADGLPDLSPTVGDAYLHGLVGIGNTNDSPFSVMRPRRDEMAFAGLPPNTLMEPTPARTLTDNAGCVWSGTVKHSYLFIPHLGNELTPTNSFTVEGWFKPEATDCATDATRSLLSTRDKSNSGWTLFFTKNANFGTGSTWGFYVSVNSDAGSKDLYFTGGADLIDWTEWKHVALSYDATTTTGTWTLYLDGQKVSSVDNPAKPAYENPPDWPFCIGGRSTDKNRSWGGGIDCVRVAKTALRPTQFLCATTGKETATDVISLWPFDVFDGHFFDGHDVMNNYHADTTWVDKWPNTENKYRLICHADDSPTITNPDRTPWFKGDPTSKHGSLQFWDAKASGTTPGRLAYVATRDPTIVNAFHARQPLTVEMYMKRTCDASACDASQWEHMFALIGPFGVGQSRSGHCLIVMYHPTYGFRVNDQYWSTLSQDSQFNANGANEPKNVWRHYAFVRTFDDEAATVNWSLYIDGTHMGTTNLPARTSSRSTKLAENFVIGGRGLDVTSFKGRIGTVRISQAALDPKDFLCGTPSEPPEKPSTVAYWRADADGASLDLSNRVDAAYGLVTTNVNGQVARARSHVPNPDTTPGFVGDPRVNVGSLSLAEGGMYAPGAALYASTRQPFTAEGWVKNPSGPLVGTWDLTTEGGWQLSAAGNGRFTLRGRGNFRTTFYVDGAFDASAVNWQDVWHHVALVYDSSVGEAGEWTFYVDGNPFGTLANLWRPTSEGRPTAPHDFVIGGTFDGWVHGATEPSHLLNVPFSGQVDMWRLSRKALVPEEFLYRDPQGLMLLVR